MLVVTTKKSIRGVVHRLAVFDPRALAPKSRAMLATVLMLIAVEQAEDPRDADVANARPVARDLEAHDDIDIRVTDRTRELDPIASRNIRDVFWARTLKIKLEKPLVDFSTVHAFHLDP